MLLTFLAVSALVIVTPGPDTAVTIRSSLLGGRQAGCFTALGVASGQLCWTLAASAGVTALLLASEPLFVALKLAGAAYLAYLGVQALAHAIRPQQKRAADMADPSEREPLSARRAYRQGLISDLANPKMAAFFTSLLPPFAPAQHPFFALLGLGFVFCAMTLAWLIVYAAGIDRAARTLRRPRVRRALDAITGGVLIALGVRIATESRR